MSVHSVVSQLLATVARVGHRLVLSTGLGLLVGFDDHGVDLRLKVVVVRVGKFVQKR